MPKNYFVARFKQYEARMEVPENVPMDTPENRDRLLARLGRMIVRPVEKEVIFSSE